MEENYFSHEDIYKEIISKDSKLFPNKIQKKFLVARSKCPLFEDSEIIDVSFHKKGNREDKIYLKFPILIDTIPRGFAILHYYKKGEIMALKKGLPKFFDSELFLGKDDEGKEINSDIKGKFLNELKVAFERGNSIEVDYLKKEDGENVQISYNSDLDLFSISSKNVTLLAGNISHLSLYKSHTHEIVEKSEDKLLKKYIWAKDAANEFFKVLSSKSFTEIKELKENFSGKTFLAEFIGHSHRKHIEGYSSPQLRFFAIVENNSKAPCFSPQKAFYIFRKLNLSTVEIFKSMKFSGYEEMIDNCRDEIEKISLRKFEDCGEGYVVYFSNCEKESGISIMKAKTNEYNILRRIREVLKQASGNKLTSFNKLELEMDIFFKHYKFPRDKEYYMEIAKYGMKLILESSEKYDFYFFRYNFADFLTMAESRVNLEIRKELLFQMKDFKSIVIITLPFILKKEQIYSILDSIKVPSYSNNFREREMERFYVLNQAPRVKDTSGILFIEYKLSEKSLNKCESILLDKISKGDLSNLSPFEFTLVKNQNIAKLPNLYKELKDFSSKNQDKFSFFDNYNSLKAFFKPQHYDIHIPNATIPSKFTIKLIFPVFTIPGIGKTTIMNELKDYLGSKFYYISSDEIKSEEISQFMEINGTLEVFFSLFRMKILLLLYLKRLKG